jgi:Na+/H+ antiporter NhaA
MIIPALLYLFINYQEDGAHGWEFQWPLILPLFGLMALLGSKVPGR